MAEIKWHDSAREHLRKIFDFRQDPKTLIHLVAEDEN
jgi:hypothetical protein